MRRCRNQHILNLSRALPHHPPNLQRNSKRRLDHIAPRNRLETDTHNPRPYLCIIETPRKYPRTLGSSPVSLKQSIPPLQHRLAALHPRGSKIETYYPRPTRHSHMDVDLHPTRARACRRQLRGSG